MGTDLVAIAHDQGFEAVAAEVAAITASASGAKLDKALTAARLGELELPVFLVFGADLSVHEPTPATACRSVQARVECVFTATGVGKPEDYLPVCKGRLGGTLPLAFTAEPAAAGQLAWRLTDVSACWKLDAVGIKVMPKPMEGLDGIGQGTDLIPPELSQLTQAEVFSELKTREADWGWCARKYPARGTLIVKFHIADDGSVGSATRHSATFDVPEAEACLLDRFKRVRFTPPMGGYQDGEYPISLL